MSMERSRRDRFSNRVPLTWEIPAFTALIGLFLLLVTPLLVQGLAALVAAGEFAWPNQDLITAYVGLFHGHFGAGLPSHARAALPADAVMWLLTVLGEVVVFGAAVVVGLWMRDLAGWNVRHGLATATQASEALGLPRLRANAAIIRPDLYGSSTGQDRTGDGSKTRIGARGLLRLRRR